ncbi:MAG TPA: hypothetical protein VFP98_01940, partial [Candidatus Polarisedimenticolia bacterium]|nr:hypothetical protein [Candidatus Polarisedimenticolia bacterium]
MRRSFFIILATVLSLSLFAGYYAFKVAGGALASAAVMVAFILMMVPYLALGFDRVVDELRAVGRNHRARLLLMGLALMLPGIVVLIGGKGTFSALNLAILAAYVSVPILILSSGR